MRERSSNVNRVGKPLRLLAVLVAPVGGSGCVGSESETEELGVTQEAASIHAWDFFGNAMSFDIGDGIACNVVPYPNVNTMQYEWATASCYLATATGRTPTRNNPGGYVM